MNSNCIHFFPVRVELYSTIDSIIFSGCSPHSSEYPKFGWPGSLRYPHDSMYSSSFCVCAKYWSCF